MNIKDFKVGDEVVTLITERDTDRFSSNMRTKRPEYKKGTIMIDKELEETIREKSNAFINDILSNVGKEYLIPDVG